LAEVKTDEQIQRPSDLSVISDVTTDMQFNSEQKSRNIYRLGGSDIWACEWYRQKGDVHYMREHLCKGVTK
jgi:hypothetical protein